MRRILCALGAMCFAFCPVDAYGQIVVDFTNNGAFDNQVAGDSVSLTDGGASRYQPTRSVFDSNFNVTSVGVADGSGVTLGSKTNTSVNGLGIGADGSGTEEQFNSVSNMGGLQAFGDELTFNLSAEGIAGGDIVLDSFSFTAAVPTAAKGFTLQSTQFFGQGYGAQFDGTGGVSFAEGGGVGTFTFAFGTDTTKVFTLTPSTDLDLSSAVVVDEGSSLTLAFFDSPSIASSSAQWTGFSFHAVGGLSAVPEPASIGLLCAVGFGFVVYRRRKKSSKETETTSPSIE